MQAEHFLIAPFPRVGYGRIESPALKQVLPEDYIRFLSYPIKHTEQPIRIQYRFPSIRVVAYCAIRNTRDEAGRACLHNHVIVIPESGFRSLGDSGTLENYADINLSSSLPSIQIPEPVPVVHSVPEWVASLLSRSGPQALSLIINRRFGQRLEVAHGDPLRLIFALQRLLPSTLRDIGFSTHNYPSSPSSEATINLIATRGSPRIVRCDETQPRKLIQDIWANLDNPEELSRIHKAWDTLHLDAERLFPSAALAVATHRYETGAPSTIRAAEELLQGLKL